MSDLAKNDKAEAKNDTADLKRSLAELRDEIRVRIHLGGMDLRDTFEKLEREADHLVAQVPPAATRALNDLAARLRRVAHALDGKQ
ncbi:MAG TPA: hypothetical protein VN947_28580 [Polyangia bacterium]|nr:hypothetical protein [Polyangia bacterium]